jgi:hypothetical protein
MTKRVLATIQPAASTEIRLEPDHHRDRSGERIAAGRKTIAPIQPYDATRASFCGGM